MGERQSMNDASTRAKNYIKRNIKYINQLSEKMMDVKKLPNPMGIHSDLNFSMEYPGGLGKIGGVPISNGG
jgi:hypothetical protein